MKMSSLNMKIIFIEYENVFVEYCYIWATIVDFIWTDVIRYFIINLKHNRAKNRKTSMKRKRK